MVIDILTLLASLAFILIGAEVFTNGVEWLGKKLNLSHGAVGSLLAAVGTALPETMIPVIALLFGTSDASLDIGIGAIVGAPFMLATLALAVTGLAAWRYKEGGRKEILNVDRELILRDLSYFLGMYGLAVLASFMIPEPGRPLVAVLLVGAYIYYVFQTIKNCNGFEDEELHPLMFARKHPDPGLVLVLVQVGVALGAIILGAHFFVGAIESLSHALGISALVLSVVIAPIATELPEKFNSIIWIRQGKDTLAMGNITGAMVFQSSIIPAIGILLTPWQLTPLALMTAVLAIISAGIVYIFVRQKGHLKPGILISSALYYTVFLGVILLSR